MPNPTRRAFVIGGAGLMAGAATIGLRPADASGPRDPYFVQMQRALDAAGIAQPVVVVDRDRLDANVSRVLNDLPDAMAWRIVSKSLPSLSLLDHVRRRADSNRLMTFNGPMLLAIACGMPEVSQLLGKPLPVLAARGFFGGLSPAQAASAFENVQWLIDTPERLQQYAGLASELDVRMAINIELDVGLHRGGVEPGPGLDQMLSVLSTSERLRFSGFMGYEAHVAGVPEVAGWRDSALQSAWAIYRESLAAASRVFGTARVEHMTRNAAGSPTYRLYGDTGVANEVSVGSALLKPSDFDSPLLADLQPACFIATPLLKGRAELRTPVLGFADGFRRALNPNLHNTLFVHGGNWLADPVDPPGLVWSSTFAHSSNQAGLHAGANLVLKPDEMVFLRPRQSESVLLQFGDLAVYAGGQIVDRWPVFPASA